MIPKRNCKAFIEYEATENRKEIKWKEAEDIGVLFQRPVDNDIGLREYFLMPSYGWRL
jgi:hypothetical protein